MKRNNLLSTNPYLKNRAKRRSWILASVVSSAAIEGIRGLLPALRRSISIRASRKSMPARHAA